MLAPPDHVRVTRAPLSAEDTLEQATQHTPAAAQPQFVASGGPNQASRSATSSTTPGQAAASAPAKANQQRVTETSRGEAVSATQQRSLSPHEGLADSAEAMLLMMAGGKGSGLGSRVIPHLLYCPLTKVRQYFDQLRITLGHSKEYCYLVRLRRHTTRLHERSAAVSNIVTPTALRCTVNACTLCVAAGVWSSLNKLHTLEITPSSICSA